MKLAGSVPGRELQEVLETAKRLGFSGTKVALPGPGESIEDIRKSYEAAGLDMVQTGCYVNLVATDEQVRLKMIERLAAAMETAGRLGVRAVVCGGGHRDPAVPSHIFSVHADNWSDRTMDILVESVEKVLEKVSERAAPLALEPWVITPLNTVDRMDELCRRIRHPKLMVNLDPVNLMNLDTYFSNGAMIRSCFDRFGDRIVVVHAKDTRLEPRPFTYHMSEAIPGEGILDYPALFREMAQLPADTPLYIEHLKEVDDICRARDYILRVAEQEGLTFIS